MGEEGGNFRSLICLKFISVFSVALVVGAYTSVPSFKSWSCQLLSLPVVADVTTGLTQSESPLEDKSRVYIFYKKKRDSNHSLSLTEEMHTEEV